MPTPKPDQPALYLIDGHAQMFRAFFAIRTAMTSPVTGEPTNALFAFAGMLIKLYRDFAPTHVAMVTDGEGPTFRDDLFDQYKANREAPPEDFEKQIPRMLEMAELFGIPVITIDGVEADDVMATLATRVEAGEFDDAVAGGDLRLRLVAKDKDLEQVLSPRVELCDLQTDTYLDVDALKEKRGITPQQVIDYQALIGDATDNVPGVKGIGPKTAAKLIDQFGSLDHLIDNTDQLKGKQKENLEHAIDSGQLTLSRQLVTLKTDVDVELDLDAAETHGLDKLDGPALLKLFRELGFNRHVKDLKQLLGDDAFEADETESTSKKNTKGNSNGNNGGGHDAGFGLFAGYGNDEQATTTAPAATLDGEYLAVRTEEQLQQLVSDLEAADIFAFDTETIGLGGDAELCGLSFAWKANHGVYVPIRSPEPDTHLTREQVLTALSPILEDADRPKIGHNLKYDLLVLRHAGVQARGAAFDTMIAAFLCGAPGLGMDDLALGELGHTCVPITDLIGHKPTRKSDPPQKSMDQVPLDLVTPYAAEDADITFRLYEKLKLRMKTLGVQRLAEDVEMPLVEVLTDMQFHGIRVAPDILREQREKLAARADELRREVLDAAGFDFNPDSTKQLGEALFETLHFPKLKKTKTGYSTDAETLEKLADMDAEELEKVPEEARAIPELLVEYRTLTKLVGTYFQNLIDARGPDGRVRASFHQTGAATGRLSSSNPNLQNIPIRTEIGREIRRAFVADKGHVLVTADYSQIELRMLAHLSEDPAMIEAFNEGQDIHRAVAAEVFHVEPDAVTSEQRSSAKMINFGIVYGVTPYGLSRRVEGLDVDAARDLIDSYRARFAGIDRFLNQCVEYAHTHGHVTTILGRRRAIPQVEAKNPQQRALGERLAINTVVQGSAADLIKLAMVNLHRRLTRGDSPVRMLLQIHDELVVEAPRDQADAAANALQSEMESAMTLKVPLVVELGTGASWYETK